MQKTQASHAVTSPTGHVWKRLGASLIDDVYIQEGARMLVVSLCQVSDHAAIASKSRDSEVAAFLMEARRNYEMASRNSISTNFDGQLRGGPRSARRYGGNAARVWHCTHV